VTSAFVLRGRRGTYSTGLALAARLGPVGRPSRRHTLCGTLLLCGRRGMWRHPCSFCVAGMALADIDLRFVWEWWPLVTTTCILRGRHYGNLTSCETTLWLWVRVKRHVTHHCVQTMHGGYVEG